MHTLKKTLTILWVGIVFSSLLLGQENEGRLTGQVYDIVSGEYLIGASVVLTKDTSKTAFVKASMTNKYGVYTISNIAFGTYFIKAKFLGYKTYIQPVEINASNKEVFIKISMQPDNIQLKEIVTTGYRDTTNTFNAMVIPVELFRALPSKSGEIDIYGGILAMPGVTNASEMSNGLYVRGSSPDQTLTLIDGITLYNPFHLGGFASSFNSEASKDIKLIKGSFPAEYGGRMSSVLDITLKEGSKEKTMYNVTLGSVGSAMFIEGPMDNKTTYIFSARYNYLNELQNLLSKNSVVPRYNFSDLTGKVSYTVNEKNKLSISGFYNDDKLSSPDAQKDLSYKVYWSNRSVNLTWLKLSAKSRILKFQLGITNYNTLSDMRDLQPNAFHQDFYSKSDLSDFSLKFDGEFFSSSTHSVKSGAEIIFHTFNLLNNDYYIENIDKYQSHDASMKGFEESVYLQEEWTLMPELIFNIGLRFYAFPLARYYRAEPRFSASYQLSGGTYIRAAYANANQFLHFITRNDIMIPSDIWFPSTPTIRPSRADQGSISYETQFDGGLYLLNVEAYFKSMVNMYEYSDTAVYSMQSGLENQIASGTGKAYGLEIFLNKRAGDFQGWVGYTLAWTERKFSGVNEGRMFYPRYDRRHDLSLVGAYYLTADMDLGASWTLSSGQPFSMPTGQYTFKGIFSNSTAKSQGNVYVDYSGFNNYRLPLFHKLDLSFNYRFIWHDIPLTASLSIYNAYARKNAFARYVSYRTDSATGEKIPTLRQFTLFPFLPAISITAKL